MIETPLTEEALRAARRRIDDFVAVHSDDESVLPAFTVLREGLGITDELMKEFIDWANRVVFTEEPDPDATALFGLIVGLIAADHG